VVVRGVVGGGGYLAWQFQVERMGRRVLEQAARAEAANDFAAAEALYQQRLQVTPGDPDIQAKYADVLVKVDKTPARQEQALGIYDEILKSGQQVGRQDVRRRAAELAIEAKHFAKARVHLEALFNRLQELEDGEVVVKDGHLQFLMGQCREQDDAAEAADTYAEAIKYKAPERLEAYQRRAALLRGPLNRKDEADKVIEAMIKSDPNDYRVYLGRGRSGHRFGLPAARDDFQRARQLAPSEPEIYLELAQMDRAAYRVDAARQTLEAALKGVPGSVPLTLALFDLELRAGRLERSIEILRQGLEVNPNQAEPGLALAMILAERGATGELFLQVNKLESIGINPILIKYLKSYYYVNRKEYTQALPLLTQLQAEVSRSPDLKARIYLLLARCYGPLKQPEQ